MKQTIVIDPITRIEGHAKITIHVDDQGFVEDARFHVTQVRGFEKFLEGRPFYELPAITARICGICPVSHLMASAKTCDELMSVRIPPAAAKLREVMHLAQILQSHALNAFHLSMPDLVLGMDSDPAKRNMLGLMEAHPILAKHGIGLRRVGQQIIEILGGKRIHPGWVVAGGVESPMTDEKRTEILALLRSGTESANYIISGFKRFLLDARFQPEVRTFANFSSLFMGTVGPKGELEFYDGKLRIVDENREIVEDQFDPARYQEIIGEAVEDWTFLKFPFYKKRGYPQGMYRVGPLARMNVIDRCGTPRADEELAEFRSIDRVAPCSARSTITSRD